jgi:hypothetical protein
VVGASEDGVGVFLLLVVFEVLIEGLHEQHPLHQRPAVVRDPLFQKGG